MSESKSVYTLLCTKGKPDTYKGNLFTEGNNYYYDGSGMTNNFKFPSDGLLKHNLKLNIGDEVEINGYKLRVVEQDRE
jgi:hypothetical protein